MITKGICLTLLLSLVVVGRCEGVSFPGPQNYGAYSKTYITQTTGINWQSQSFTVTLPFQVYMHAKMMGTVVVNSTGALIFRSQTSNWFIMKLVYGSDNNMTGLEVFKTDKNVTIHYKGITSSSAVIQWYVTLYNEGSNKFLIDIISNGTKLSTLCVANYCYQDVTAGTALYSTCDTTCFTCLRSSCGSQTECPSKCPNCFKTIDTQTTCVNMLALVIAISVVGGVLTCTVFCLGLYWTGVLSRCCGGCCGGCCRCRCCDCYDCLYDCKQCCYKCAQCCRKASPGYKSEMDMKTLEMKRQEKKRQEDIEERGMSLPQQTSGIPIVQSSSETIAGIGSAKVADISSTAQCSICLNKNSDVRTSCGHDFHRHCLELWIKKSADCPKCGRAKELLTALAKKTKAK